MKVKTRKTLQERIFFGTFVILLGLLMFVGGCAFHAEFDGVAGSKPEIKRESTKSIKGGSVNEFRKRSVREN